MAKWAWQINTLTLGASDNSCQKGKRKTSACLVLSSSRVHQATETDERDESGTAAVGSNTGKTDDMAGILDTGGSHSEEKKQTLDLGLFVRESSSLNELGVVESVTFYQCGSKPTYRASTNRATHRRGTSRSAHDVLTRLNQQPTLPNKRSPSVLPLIWRWASVLTSELTSISPKRSKPLVPTDEPFRIPDENRHTAKGVGMGVVNGDQERIVRESVVNEPVADDGGMSGAVITGRVYNELGGNGGVLVRVRRHAEKDQRFGLRMFLLVQTSQGCARGRQWNGFRGGVLVGAGVIHGDKERESAALAGCWVVGTTTGSTPENASRQAAGKPGRNKRSDVDDMGASQKDDHD
ncbi:hypothetical protein FB45DRAFT_863316 [Roridomyces roridus]|uniref:Uncharacterized protein n=1 Tax=Roridomyces roridus TaxID=1738132 RepID=A0AAD7C937_9AGAR|nr:hypothetical protein FB45DRAFT_863316 [Roridomyces roridus]